MSLEHEEIRMSQALPFGTVTTCSSCGGRILAASEVCPRCGVRQFGTPPVAAPVERRFPIDPLASDRKIVPTLIFCFFLGIFGAHRFYVRRPVSGVLMLCTFGGLTIWWMVDLITILLESFRDGSGRRLTEWV